MNNPSIAAPPAFAQRSIAATLRAVARARLAILTIALTYVVSVIVGAGMVHAGDPFALGYGDNLVTQAQATDPAAIALQNGNRLGAALLDSSRNLLLGAVPSTVAGLGIVFPYPLVAYRGWVGGTVSVWGDQAHTSRLTNPGDAVYYLITLLLQLIPYSLAGGAGVNLGMTAFLRAPATRGPPGWAFRRKRPGMWCGSMGWSCRCFSSRRCGNSWHGDAVLACPAARPPRVRRIDAHRAAWLRAHRRSERTLRTWQKNQRNVEHPTL